MTGASAPGLLVEAARAHQIGWPVLGIYPNSDHKYGYHMPVPEPRDYSLRGDLNRPVGPYACAFDLATTVGAGRLFCKSVFEGIAAGRPPAGLAEMIGDPDGHGVRYWAWNKPAIAPYRGSGHSTWCHLGRFRAYARKDCGWLTGWKHDGPPADRPGTLVSALRSRLQADVKAGRRSSDRVRVYDKAVGMPNRRGLTLDVLGVPAATVLKWFGAPDPYGQKSIQVGQRNDGVTYTELLFNSRVEGAGAHDAYFSPSLGQLVKDWQKHQGLTRVHGRVDLATLLQLGQPETWD